MTNPPAFYLMLEAQRRDELQKEAERDRQAAAAKRDRDEKKSTKK